MLWQEFHFNLLDQIFSEYPYLQDQRVREAMESVPRHLLAPNLSLEEAYRDCAQPIGLEQTISQPSLVAWMTQLLELSGGERVLEIGTGSGYQTAILSQLASEVCSIERMEALSMATSQRLQELNLSNIRLKIGDGFAGWPERAPFDRILLTAAPPDIPGALVKQLHENGMLIAPVGVQGQDQILLKGIKWRGKLRCSEISRVRFVPMLEGVSRSDSTSPSQTPDL